MSAAIDLDDDENLCPLLRRVGAQLENVTAIQISRLTLDEEGREVKAAWVSTVPGEATLEDVARAHGGGTYRAQGTNGGRFIKSCNDVFEIEGPPRTRGGTASAAPVQETSSGLVSVTGLDPMAQSILALCQQHTAAIREDAQRYAEALHAIVMEAVKRPEPAAPASSERFLLAQVERMSAELAAQRTSAGRESSDALKLQLAKLRLEKGDGPAAVLAAKLADNADGILGLLAQWVAKNQGIDLTPATAADVARAALPTSGT